MPPKNTTRNKICDEARCKREVGKSGREEAHNANRRGRARARPRPAPLAGRSLGTRPRMEKTKNEGLRTLTRAAEKAPCLEALLLVIADKRLVEDPMRVSAG